MEPIQPAAFMWRHYPNPGPEINKCLKSFHWNLNSICARDRIKIPLIETYDALHKFDIIAISESMLDETVKNDENYIEGLSKEIYRNDHPSKIPKLAECVSFFAKGYPSRDELTLSYYQKLLSLKLE